MSSWGSRDAAGPAAVTVLDGGMSRELERLGAPLRQPEWSALALIESPSIVADAHRSYVAAGARVITTDAYAVVPFHIGEVRFRSEGRRLAALSAELAREVADEDSALGVRVAGCLPPVLGSYRPDLFVPGDARPILEVLVDAQAPHVDLWLAETLSSVAEVRLVGEVLGGSASESRAGVAGAGVPLWVSFTLDDHRSVLRSGEEVAAAAAAAVEAGASAVLFNCSQPGVMEESVRVAASVVGPVVAVGAYANAFDPGVAGDPANELIHEISGELTPAVYLEFAERWVEAGATIVGGCCGIGPGHIRALSERWTAE